MIIFYNSNHNHNRTVRPSSRLRRRQGNGNFRFFRVCPLTYSSSNVYVDSQPGKECHAAVRIAAEYLCFLPGRPAAPAALGLEGRTRRRAARNGVQIPSPASLRRTDVFCAGTAGAAADRRRVAVRGALPVLFPADRRRSRTRALPALSALRETPSDGTGTA